MSGAELYAKANDAFFDDDYDEAMDLFTQAIQAEPKNSEFILKRCIVYQKLNKCQEAAADAKTALKELEESQGSRSLLARAHLQTGITQHHLKNYTEAQKHFETSKELNPAEKTLVTWLRKNAEKLPKVEPSSIVSESSAASAAPVATPQQARVRHEWFQNEKFITVEVFMKNIKPDTISLDFFETSLSLSIKMPSGSDYSLELDPLAREILPKESSYKILSTKLEIKLKKKEDGILWGALEGENDLGSAMSSTTPKSTKQPKDWNKLVRDIDDDQEKAQGEQALNGLFQQIYKDADEDTKRAMMKSFVESNGTCLSTNWNEVGSGTVETKPPEGMVAKKY